MEPRPYLAGLHERLRQEPCQTVQIAPAPGVEQALEPLAAFKGEEEPRFRGSRRLRLLPSRNAPPRHTQRTEEKKKRRVSLPPRTSGENRGSIRSGTGGA